MAKVLTFAVLLFVLFALSAPETCAQSTAFTYQGSLQVSGSPANGNYDFEFLLFDAVGGGAQFGTTVTRTNVAVANGAFAVSIDFGNQFTGAPRFIEIHVRPSGGGGYTTLSPRSQVQTSPYAIRSFVATSADDAVKFGGQLPDQYVLTNDTRLTNARNPLPGSSDYIQNSNAGQTASMNITGTGQVAGTVPGASFSVTNAQPGILNPSPANLPPTAVIGQATSTSNSNAGVIGIGNGAAGIGVIGLTTGSGTGGDSDAIGVIGLATNTSGSSTGISAQISSPSGSAISARTSATGLIFQGESDDGGINPKVTINALGQIVTQAGVWAKGFHLNSTQADLLENGDFNTFGSITLNGGSISTPGAATFGTLTVQNLGGTPGVSALCATNTNLVKFCSSSGRYKTNISEFHPGLDLIRKLRPVSFNWKDGGMADMGLVAEEVAAAEPLLSTTNASGQVEGVKYDRVGVVLINAVKEQQEQIEAQNTRIEALERQNQLEKVQIAAQQRQIDLLMKMVCAQNGASNLCKSSVATAVTPVEP